MFQLVIEDKEEEVPLGVRKGEEEEYKVGDRVAILIQEPLSPSSPPPTGTVLYVGPGPAGAQSQGLYYLGIEWDDPSRGRHNGTLDGVAFFKPVKHSEAPRSSSFLRPSRKLLRLRSFLEAVKERYCSEDDKISSLKFITMDIPQIHTLIPEQEELSALSFPNLTTLTLTSSLLSCHFLDLLSQLLQNCPKLSILDLSRNKFLKFSLEEKSSFAQDIQLPFVKTVALADNSLTWSVIVSFSKYWPNVEELAVPFNKIGRLEDVDGDDLRFLQKLKRLDLEGCGLGVESSWSEIVGGLSQLTSLSNLNLASNKIVEISVKADTDAPLPIATLNLTSNSLPSFSSITALYGWFPSLESLRISQNPFLSLHDSRTSTQLVIARLPSLKKLEGVEIIRQERKDAELDYCKGLLKEWKQDKEKREELLKDNPRFLELAKGFDLIQDMNEDKVDGKSGVSGQLLDLKFVLIPGSSTQPTLQRRVLRTMTVQKLRALIQRSFRLPRKPLTLTAKSIRNPEIFFVLENDLVEVGQYSLEDGDQIIVEIPK